MVPGKALQALCDLSEIAREDGVAGNLGLPRGVERPGGASQMRGAADATRAWRHYESRLRILVAKDHLEAAEEFGLGPRINDDAVLDIDAHVEVALDASATGEISSV